MSLCPLRRLPNLFVGAVCITLSLLLASLADGSTALLRIGTVVPVSVVGAGPGQPWGSIG
jgi:hypothetical protein